MNSTHSSEPRFGVISGGNWIVDHVKVIDQWPDQDGLAIIASQSSGNGGGSYNLLKNLSKMRCGFPLEGVGLVGRDADGETILEDCARHDIEKSQLHQTPDSPTSFTDVMTVSTTGRRTFFHQHGANAQLGIEHFNLSTNRARIFYLGYLGLLRKLETLDAEQRTGASRLFEQATKLGMITISDLVSSDAADFSEVIRPSLPHLDYLFLNEYELHRLTGGEKLLDAVKNLPAMEAMARDVLQRGVRRAVVVHFPEAAVCVPRDAAMIVQPSARVPQSIIVGTAGAGDAFASGFTFGLHEQWDWQRCLELGVAVATVSLRAATCSDAIQDWRECLAFARQLGYHEIVSQT